MKEGCLCIVEEDVIKAFSQSGNIESTPLLFKVSKVLAIHGGLILERNVLPSDSDQQKSKKIPTIFSLLSPLDEPRPVIGRYAGNTSFMRDKTLHVVFTFDDPPLLLTYDSFIGVHSLWLIREAKKEEYPELPTNNDSSYVLPHPTNQRFPTPILKPSAYSRLSLTTSSPAHMTVTRTSSPVEKGQGRLPQSPFMSSPQMSRLVSSRTLLESPSGQHSLVYSSSILQSPDIFRSSATVANSFHEDTFWHTIEPLEPEICLDHIWEEVSNVRHASKGEASKAFIATDVCGVKYVCFLVPHVSKLRLTKFSCGERAGQVIFGSTFDISAIDAAPIKGLNMILVLSPDNTLALYSGKHKGCDIKLNSLVTIIQNDITNQEDSQLSFLSETVLASPFHSSQSWQPSSTFDNTSGNSVNTLVEDERKPYVLGLMESNGHSAILKCCSGFHYRMTLPPLTGDETGLSVFSL
ncbi:anaphase-promoting complex subunit 1-like [Xenia sp. Carnegie-2017]|uniref:anaphase-promoting complex subunit 1-like n=1 Tax=Xenia sp. Carnegie-2017 TaxID=2897299 RepID=UPI001F036D40|nr:anaphase-promoting complex subunit 1-like [Xenia sp. Carnegie-2017]